MQAGYSQRALDDILRHNKPLLSEDATIFQNEAAVLQKDVARLKARMDALIVELSALHVQHTAASHALQQRNSVHAPIHRLPDEVILHIFRLCIPDIVDDSCLDVQGVRFRIFRVCRWWRDIATNSPSLWAVLVVRSWPTRRDPAVYAISRYLSLSRDQPLQIYFSYPEMQNHGIPYDSTDACSVVFRDIMNLLDSHWHRWETFSVSNKTHYQWRPVEWGHGTAFPRLREISICDEDPFRLLLLAPTLTKVKITGLQRLDRFNHLTGLTHLHIFESKESFRPYPIKDILERHASLTQLHFVSATRTHVFEERIVEHANLEQLVLSSLQHLNCISVPSLKGLHMSSYAVPSSSGVDSLIAFVHRSQCALRTVTLDTRALYQEIDKIISSFLPLCAESLTQLKLVVWPSGPNVEVLRRLLGALTRQVSSAGLLPHLTSFAIELHIGRAIHPILPAIAAMLKSRRDVELSKRWKVDVLDDVGMSIEDHYEATDRALFTAEVESLREGGLLFWTTENMSGNSFYTAPWLEEQKRFPLKTPSGLLAPKHRPLYPPSSWMGRFEDDDSDLTDLSDDDDIWSSPIHPQQHTGTSNSLGVGVSATGSSHPFQIYPIDHYGVDLGSLSNTDFGHVLPPPLQFEGTHSLDNPASDVYSEFSFDETGPPVIPPSPIASDTDDESVLLPRTLDFMDAPGSPSQFPSPFNHPLAHFTQQTVGAVPLLAQARNPSTREGSVLLQDVGCQLAGVENGDHCLFGDTDELGQPLSPLMLSPTLEVGSSSMSI